MERKQRGAGGLAEMTGLYLHCSKKPKRMRSEANWFIFRADRGNAQCLAFFFFSLSCFKPQPKEG